MPYRCPECRESDGLWEAIEVTVGGWRELDDKLEPKSAAEYDTCDVLAGPYTTGEVGCSKCDWRGRGQDSFEAIGIDGEPLPFIHPNQLEIGVAA
jgi:hypothetical protein